MNNKGFSLVELVIATAVSSIILLGLTAFVATSSRVYASLYNTAELQYQAQIVKVQLKQRIANCNGGIFYSPGGNVLGIVNIESDGTKTIYCYKAEDSTLYFGTETSENSSGNLQGNGNGNQALINFISTADNINAKMSDSVESFSVAANSTGGIINEITLNITFKNGEKHFETSQNIYVRNSPLFDSDINNLLSRL